MPLQATSGAASYDAFGGGVPVVPNYIEDVFSTYLYTGTSPTLQTITNNIDLSTKGGLVWVKARVTAYDNYLVDSARGNYKKLESNSTGAQFDGSGTSNGVALTTSGFTVSASNSQINLSGEKYASWTFRKQPKFFDVVTYTGNGATTRNISHNLGSTPGFILVKCTSTTGSWACYHRSLGATYILLLNLTNAATAGTPIWDSTEPTSTQFTVNNNSFVNTNGATYVAYLFAHDAGGFGLTGTDNVISCGSYAATGSGAVTINLGYEPQWVMVKRAVRTGGTEDSIPDGWSIFDNMRGITASGIAQNLRANLTDAELAVATPSFTATGMSMAGNYNTLSGGSAATYIYIAIRRGPMKVPTSGTSVFGLSARTGTGANATVTGGQTDDAVLIKNRGSAVGDLFASRLTGTGYLETSAATAEVAAGVTILQANPWDVMDGVKVGTTSTITNASANTFINYLFKRAPSFFDEVCYTGTGGTGSRSLTHNLSATPEFIILKRRNAVSGWQTGSMFTSTTVTRAVINSNADQDLNSLYSGQSIWGGQPTSSAFLVDAGGSFNTSAATYVAYLFSTCPNVSKVGSYTGTGTTLQVDCGFTGGARFVLIKRTDSTGDWYVWDSARGIVAGNDPYLLLNSTAAEVTSTDYVDTYSAGFEITSSAPSAINASGGTFIFLAIA